MGGRLVILPGLLDHPDDSGELLANRSLWSLTHFGSNPEFVSGSTIFRLISIVYA